MMQTLQLPRYAVPAIPLAFLGLPLYVYLPAHYAALPGIGLAAAGGVLLAARLIDLLTDPLVGVLHDRLRRRLRPQWLMVVGGVLLLCGAWWLFQPVPTAGPGYLFGWLTVTYLGWTLLAIPYYALGAELGASGDSQQQLRVAAWREAGMIVGTLSALILPVVFATHSPLATSAGALLWLIPLALLAVLPLNSDTLVGGAARISLVMLWRDASRPARELLGVHLLNALAGGTAATLFALYVVEVLGLDERGAGLLLLLYFVSGLLALPLWNAVARRLGMVRTWRVAMLVAAGGFLPAAVLGDGDWWSFSLVCVLTGSTLAADIALPAALQARIVDIESRRLARPRGGALFGLWGMASKLALALAAGVALPLLALLSSPGRGLSEAMVIPWLYAGLPVLIKCLAVILLSRTRLFSSELSDLTLSEKEVRDDQTLVDGAAGNGVPMDAGRM